MKFDRNAPGQGVEAVCRLENGKAFLEWHFYIIDDGESQKGQGETAGDEVCRYSAGRENAAWSRGQWGMKCGCGVLPGSEQTIVRVILIDREGNAAEGMQLLWEEEPLETILIQPCLWQGTQDPCLYSLEARLEQNGKCLDKLCRKLPLRVLEMGNGRELFLNGQLISPRAVYYTLPEAASGTACQRLVMEDFQWLLKLGADCIYVDEGELRKFPGFPEFLLQLCDRLGFLLSVPQGDGDGEKIPLFRGRKDSFFPSDVLLPSSLYYQYKVRWSKDPFVYIVPESVRKLKSGNYEMKCFSNGGRVALYSDGFLFELKKGEREFCFQEVPAKGPCIRLSAEGEGCSASLSIHKSFVGL